MQDFEVTGSVLNSHDYDEMSKSVIRLIHEERIDVVEG